MFLYHENGIEFKLDWNWLDNGEYPIIQFGKFLFLHNFKIAKDDDTPLIEGTDYLRILRPSEVYNKFGEDFFGGIVLLSTDSVNLSIEGLASTELESNLPDSIFDPYVVSPYTDVNPMDGSYQDLINMVDELRYIVPNIVGNVLPIYIRIKFPEVQKVMSLVTMTISLTMDKVEVDTSYTIDPRIEQALPRIGLSHCSMLPVDFGNF